MLIEAAPQFVSNEAIIYALWQDEPPESNALRSHIYNLRKALSAIDLPDQIETQRGKGYALKIEPSEYPNDNIKTPIPPAFGYR